MPPPPFFCSNTFFLLFFVKLMAMVTETVMDSIGSTSMVKLRLLKQIGILAKLEYLNPTGSNKDRLAKYLLDGNSWKPSNYYLQKLERKTPFQTASSEDKPNNRTLIIPMSCNLGISLATLAAQRKRRIAKGGPSYRIISILPERISKDRIALLKALGAEILRVPNEVRREAPESAYSVAQKLAEQLSDATVIDESQLTDLTVYHELAKEIIEQINEKKERVDHVFIGVESGATITGVAQCLKKEMPHVKVYGVEPLDSVLGEHAPTSAHARADWKVEDIGNNFIPKVLDKSLVDKWVKVSDQEAYSVSRRLIRDEGILCGPSSGAVVAAVLKSMATDSTANHPAAELLTDQQQQQEQQQPGVLVILNDAAKNYTSTLLSDEWLLENDLADDLISQELQYVSQDRYRAASVEDLQLPAAVTIAPSATVAHAYDLMLEREYSQLPVIKTETRKLVGYVSLSHLENQLEHGHIQMTDKVDDVMYRFVNKNNKKNGMPSNTSSNKYEVITPDTSLADLAKFFEKNSFAVITDTNRKWCLGVATKYDLISFLHRRRQFF
ncbi:tryptophan synthase beta subunit-like PLP-dependent enzyme [Mycotypha africana]|uniref:tryptophan synthase beta subunit-like PLP-dependent enzyme n=1 Tax=Mycotypha africana TaxID=64632 RepID=UPI0023004D97|nr:tryptophan synthase beta subunit-like PLP-dependent enzyme [Mycotypha africana]KAI8973330.1 tryptophan synthase beta subunit-like PLP-dependent enzyme [Mycotypha africana]